MEPDRPVGAIAPVSPLASSQSLATGKKATASNVWQPCCRGENLGATLEATFSPITARQVRLNITEATDLDGESACDLEGCEPAC